MKIKSILLSMGLMAFTALGNASTIVVNGELQSIINELSTADGIVNVQTNQVDNDEIWKTFALTASTTSFIASYWGNNSDPSLSQGFGGVFGIYDIFDINHKVELQFQNQVLDGNGNYRPSRVTFAVDSDGWVSINNQMVGTTGTYFKSSRFGFYNTNTYNNVEYTGYSQSSLNKDDKDAMLTYSNKAGFLNPGQSLLAFDPNLSRDYDDLVVVLESAAPVPAPGVLALMGLGLAGIGLSRRKTKK